MTNEEIAKQFLKELEEVQTVRPDKNFVTTIVNGIDAGFNSAVQAWVKDGNKAIMGELQEAVECAIMSLLVSLQLNVEKAVGPEMANKALLMAGLTGTRRAMQTNKSHIRLLDEIYPSKL